MSLPVADYRLVTWREGANAMLTSRFAAVRVRSSHHAHLTKTLRPEEWLLV